MSRVYVKFLCITVY